MRGALTAPRERLPANRHAFVRASPCAMRSHRAIIAFLPHRESPMPTHALTLRLAFALTLVAASASQIAFAAEPAAPAERPSTCKACEAWNREQAPFRLYGNSWYVGVKGLSAVLVTSPQGHVLIDGDLPESVPRIVANIAALGFRIEDVKVIVNSHAHFDHAGGIAELQQLSGADVVASAWGARALKAGRSLPEDPQVGFGATLPKVARTRAMDDGETLKVGPITITAHATSGHTPGGMSWSWTSCDGERCLDLVYADSLNPVSTDDFRFSDTTTYPTVLADFERSFTTLSALRCDVLITAHPEVGDLWSRLARRDAGDADALIDTTACRRLVDASRAKLAARLEKERAAPTVK
jgi:metallo-beta-lactamase class B